MQYSTRSGTHYFRGTLDSSHTFFCHTHFSKRAKLYLSGKYIPKAVSYTLYEVTSILVYVKEITQPQANCNNRYGMIYLPEQDSLCFDSLHCVLSGFTKTYYSKNEAASLANIKYDQRLIKVMQGCRRIIAKANTNYEVTSVRIFLKGAG